MLTKALHVKGQVVNETGKPIDKVVILYTNRPSIIETDANGRFEFDSSAPLFVAVKSGYENTLIENDGSEEMRVVLHKLPHGSFPTCTETDLAHRAPGWKGVLQVPEAGVTKAFREKWDVDYGSRTLRVKSGATLVYAYQGRGPMWGGEMPQEEMVWGAVRYKARSYDLDGWSVDDAKIWLANGSCMRIVGTFQESIFYEKIDCGLVKPLDDLLDRVCVDHEAFKRRLP